MILVHSSATHPAADTATASPSSPVGLNNPVRITNHTVHSAAAVPDTTKATRTDAKNFFSENPDLKRNHVYAATHDSDIPAIKKHTPYGRPPPSTRLARSSHSFTDNARTADWHAIKKHEEKSEQPKYARFHEDPRGSPGAHTVIAPYQNRILLIYRMTPLPFNAPPPIEPGASTSFLSRSYPHTRPAVRRRRRRRREPDRRP